MSATPTTATKLLQLAPQIHERYHAYVESILEEGPLDEKSRALAALAAAITLGKQASIQSFLTSAKQQGVTNEEIGHIAALVDLVRIDAHQQPLAEPAAPRPAAKSCC